ncbi:M15 family metallopeptidase [Paenibacillus sp. FSL H7-0756]|uniref:M15 family metallopeptidase n=1 Tax=Paenibacillus sp. FSL H7-0756 TaxID=2954738 RepID=UPI0030F65A55
MLTLDQVKLKSMPRMSGLHPVLVAATVVLIERCYARGVPIIITQGLRTIAEQDALYAQGRTKPGSIVTNARGGYSYHNYGLAVDFALLLPDGSSVSWDMTRDGDKDAVADWAEVVQEAKALGFESGGDWTSFKDYPHLQMTFGLSLADLRAGRKPTGVQMDAAYARIDKLQGEADELSKEDVKRISDLEIQYKAIMMGLESLVHSRDVLKEQALQQAGDIKDLKDKASMLQPPAWARPAIDAAVKAGLLDTPAGGSYDFYRTLTVLHRAGLLITIHEGAK